MLGITRHIQLYLCQLINYCGFEGISRGYRIGTKASKR